MCVRNCILRKYVQLASPLKARQTCINSCTLRAQRLINLEIPVLVRSLKSSNVELGKYLDGKLFKCCLSAAANPSSLTEKYQSVKNTDMETRFRLRCIILEVYRPWITVPIGAQRHRWSQAMLSSVSTWMGDSRSSVVWVLLLTL